MIDTPECAGIVRSALTGQPVEIESTDNPATGLILVGRVCPDIVLLGPVSGPVDVIGFLEVVRRAEPDLPVVVGIGPGNSALAGQAALLGAAVLAHPYRIDALLRLVTSLVRREHPLDVHPPDLDLGRLRIDGAAPRMWLDGTEERLPMREYLLLRYLAERSGAVVARKDIIRAIWGTDGVRGSNTLTVHVMRLRKKLHDDETDPRWIQVIRGVGYQFTVPSPSTKGVDTYP
jgi:DNA-binding response OmpR family regulator